MSNNVAISDEYLEALDNYYTNQLWIASMELSSKYRNGKFNEMQVSDCMIDVFCDILEEIKLREGLTCFCKQDLIENVYDSYKAAINNIRKEVSDNDI